MIHDYTKLNLSSLALAYQTEFNTLYNEALLLAKVAHDKKLKRAMDQLAVFDSEAGSDGHEEAALEVIGAFDPKSVQLPIAAIKETARDKVVSEWLVDNQISQKLSWFAPQILAYFGSWDAVKVNGKYCPEATYKQNVVDCKNLFGLGSVLLAKTKRSLFFKDAPKGSQQYKSPIHSLVPIVLAGFKKYQDIPYMQWDLSKLEFFENSEIVELFGCQSPKLSLAEVLALRNTAITPRTGSRAGRPGNPATCASLYHLADTAIGHLPKLAKYIILQTWCAHPSNATQYAIRDLDDWDKSPEPLTGTDIFIPVDTPKLKYSSEDAWMY